MKIDLNKKEFIYWAHLLWERGLVAGRSGNVSARTSQQKILLTVTNCYLGMLTASQIAVAGLDGRILAGSRDCRLTMEKDLHLGILRKFPKVNVVIHAHPIHTVAFFECYRKLDIFGFESKLHFEKLPVIPQSTLTVTRIAPVLAALDTSNIAVLKNHGVVAMGEDFRSAFALIEMLEEQAKVNLLLRGKQRQR
ncbi:MAG: class II aldolase/adducin family protein [bacterium]|nr:class II aldolase/adducin family protein [bacterium]MDD5353610.1 class II aldolase/adducin family protein [bacterium]MDD5757195.1 class II aldolase/adducin family protein [bacterium]